MELFLLFGVGEHDRAVLVPRAPGRPGLNRLVGFGFCLGRSHFFARGADLEFGQRNEPVVQGLVLVEQMDRTPCPKKNRQLNYSSILGNLAI